MSNKLYFNEDILHLLHKVRMDNFDEPAEMMTYKSLWEYNTHRVYLITYFINNAIRLNKIDDVNAYLAGKSGYLVEPCMNGLFTIVNKNNQKSKDKNENKDIKNYKKYVIAFDSILDVPELYVDGVNVAAVDDVNLGLKNLYLTWETADGWVDGDKKLHIESFKLLDGYTAGSPNVLKQVKEESNEK